MVFKITLLLLISEQLLFILLISPPDMSPSVYKLIKDPLQSWLGPGLMSTPVDK